MDDELRARLRAADPARHDAPADSWIDQLVEATVQEQRTMVKDARRRRWLVPAAAAAVVAGIAAAGALAFAGGDDGESEPAAQETLQLELQAPDAMQMCATLEAETLTAVPVALEGTVTDIEGGTVTLDVEQWFKGGDADVVELVNPGQADDFAMIEDFIEFEEGKRYLIVAEEGVVSSCSSGEWSPESAAIFAEAFGG